VAPVVTWIRRKVAPAMTWICGVLALLLFLAIVSLAIVGVEVWPPGRQVIWLLYSLLVVLSWGSAYFAGRCRKELQDAEARRALRTLPPPPSESEERILRRTYEALLKRAEFDGTVFWTRWNSFLTANSILFVFSATYLGLAPVYNKALVILIAFTGDLLCLLWGAASFRGMVYYHACIHHAGEIEQRLSLGSDGMFTRSGKAVGGKRADAFGYGRCVQALLPPWPRWGSTTRIGSIWVPLCFGLLWTGLMVTAVATDSTNVQAREGIIMPARATQPGTATEDVGKGALARSGEHGPTCANGAAELGGLENGSPIRVVKVDYSPIGVDTPEDLARVRQLLAEEREP